MHVKITQEMHTELKNHLHNGDGLEALAFALCGRMSNNKEDYLFVHEIYNFQYEKCERELDLVAWKTIDVEHILEKACSTGLSIIKIHSHFEEDSDFSHYDDKSDKDFFESVYSWTDDDRPHASLIMYPSGKIKGRVIGNDLKFSDVGKITVVGHDILKYHSVKQLNFVPEEFKRNSQAFGSMTVNQLKSMKIGVVGCSGTGSPLIEQLVRLGVGELVLVDNDVVEEKNMNRILGTKISDAKNNVLKVDVLRRHINEIGLGTSVICHSNLLENSQETIDELASCDFLFGCMDSVEGRHYLNLISTYYLVPLIDMGVQFLTDENGGIDSIIANIHYLYPGSSTLQERKVYSEDELSRDSIKRLSPDEYEERKSYFANEVVESPAVISVNSTCSSYAVNELLARIHPFRYKENKFYSSTVINFCDWDVNYSACELTTLNLHKDYIGVGAKQPNINI
ncbi:ThiF family adenylyltransferase [Wenyingzhuangia sp. IMCC45533]